MTNTPQRPPRGLGSSGRALWRSVAEDFDLDQHEQHLLREACRTVDLCDRLQTVLDADGPMTSGPAGPKAHPAAVELRQQRITLARLLAALNIPTDDDARTGQRRAPRGVYAIRGGAS